MNALNQLESMEFDWRFGTISSQTGPNLLTTVFGVDKFGRSTGETRPNGTRTTLTYNFCAGCVQDAVYNIERTETLAATGAQVAPTTRTYFDTLGREIHRVTVGFSGQEIHSAITFNGLGQAETASRNYSPGQTNIGLTQYEYDGAGRRKKMTFPDNSYFTYTFNGRTKLVANTNGVTASQRSNSQGQLIEKIDAVSTSVVSSVLYEYDNWNNLSKTTDAMGNSIVTTYDLLGRKTRQVDPDLGTWDYVINNLGQVTSQKDAKLQNTVFTYDLLGRLTSREEADLTSSWYYEKNAAGVACSMGVGKLCEATASNGYFRRLTYDSLGRKSLQTSHIDTDYLTDWTYDTAGRLSTETFPAAVPGNRLRLNYNYSPLGWLANVTNNATGVAYWTRNAENSDGDITAETFGNGLIGTRSYDPVSGRIAGIKLGTAATPGSVQDQSYHFDILGRMDSRQDNTTGIGASETFGYDRLNRLSTVSFVAPGVGSQSSTVTYDAIGNILTKTGVGTYAYPLARSARPHAVSGVTGTVNGVSNPAYTYDDNGNMLTGGARNFTWTSFNMPATLTKIAQAGSPGAGTSTFLYGAEHQRVKQTWSGAGKTITTTYVDGGNFEKEVDSATGLTAAKHYVVADGRVVAIHTSNSNATEDVRYLSSDHLGSTTVVTAASGTVMERQAFDPWGDRRTATGSQAGASDPTNSIQPTGTSRGFTGHEHLDQGNMGLVHTNGRIYDPTLGRFLSPDPFVQSADFTQSYNRYSYIWNSPLNGVDPTGYVADDAGSVTVSGRAWAAADGGDWSVVCRGSGCEGLFAPSQWIESRVTQLMSKGKEVTVLMGKNGRARLLISNFETTTLNDGVTQGVRETRASEDEPRYYGTSDEIVGQWCDFELFSRLALDAGVPKPYADNIGLIALIGNPKNGLSKLAKLAKLKPSQLHHICTDKFCISLRRGGPWTPRFKDIFKGAGMKLDDALNKVLVAGHKGPHPEEYHTYVYDTLLRELRGKSGEEYKETLQKTLVRLGEEISTPGTYLNGLVRNPK
jgi:RHS repeat-associated protein